MSRYDASGKGLDEEPTFDEDLFYELLKVNRREARDSFDYAGKPTLNSVSEVLDSLELMSRSQWDSVFFMLELIFETNHSDQKAMHYDALGRIIGKHLMEQVEREIEINSYNATIDDYKHLTGESI